MKKIATLFLTIFFAAALYGQASIDYILKAKAFISEGKVSQATVMLDDAIAENADFRLYMLRAEAKIASGDLSGAISDFNSANNLAEGSGNMVLQESIH